MNSADALLSVTNLRVSVGTRHGTLEAVRGVDLSVGTGDSLGLIGESGSGKSLTCLAVTGLLPANAKASGQIRFQGRELGDHPDQLAALRGAGIGMVFQDATAAINPIRTVGAQLRETLMLHQRLTRAEAGREALAVMRSLGIADAELRLGSYPHQLSGGMNQRIMIALAMAGKPKLLIADEPTTALDTTTQAQILRLIDEARSRAGSSLLLITHDLGLVHETCTNIAVMYAGRIVESGRTEEVLAHPQHPYTSKLVRALPRLDARPRRLVNIPGTVPLLHEMPAGCAFADRCDRAQDKCRLQQPPPAIHANSLAACWFPGDFAPVAATQTPPPPSAAPVPPAEAPVLLEARDLTCTYEIRRGLLSPRLRVEAVKDVSFAVRSGQTLGLIGESGCGKSTVGRTLMGLKQPSGGSVLIAGRPRAPKIGPTEAKRMQLVFQDSLGALDPRMTIGQQIDAPLRAIGVSDPGTRAARVQRTMDDVGLPPDMADRYPHQVSGGQRQRVVIARALVLDPEIMVLDEPVASLDLSIQAQIVNLLLDLQEKHGLTYVLISHDLRVVRMMSHQVAVMYAGQIVEAGDVAQVLEEPRHPYTRMLRAAIPKIGQQEKDKDSLVAQGEPPSILHRPVGCAFHPRCPLATELCRTAPPPLKRSATASAAVACHYA